MAYMGIGPCPLHLFSRKKISFGHKEKGPLCASISGQARNGPFYKILNKSLVQFSNQSKTKKCQEHLRIIHYIICFSGCESEGVPQTDFRF